MTLAADIIMETGERLPVLSDLSVAALEDALIRLPRAGEYRLLVSKDLALEAVHVYKGLAEDFTTIISNASLEVELVDAPPDFWAVGARQHPWVWIWSGVE